MFVADHLKYVGPNFQADEFGQWMPVCNRFDEQYLAAYHSFVQKSAPEEDYRGRLDLYKL